MDQNLLKALLFYIQSQVEQEVDLEASFLKN